jgi:hypothetical protein
MALTTYGAVERPLPDAGKDSVDQIDRYTSAAARARETSEVAKSRFAHSVNEVRLGQLLSNSVRRCDCQSIKARTRKGGDATVSRVLSARRNSVELPKYRDVSSDQLPRVTPLPGGSNAVAACVRSSATISARHAVVTHAVRVADGTATHERRHLCCASRSCRRGYRRHM